MIYPLGDCKSSIGKRTVSAEEFGSRLLPDRVSEVKLHNLPERVIALD